MRDVPAAMPRLSIILPTIGRPGLAVTLASVAAAAPKRGDELLVACDGAEHEAGVRRMVARSGLRRRLRVRVALLEPAGGCWGQPARNLALTQATGDHLLFTQDDQLLRRGALAVVRERVARSPERVHLFRVVPQARFVVPQEPGRLEQGYVDVDCAVVPNVPALLGEFGLHYDGDWDFIRETVARTGRAPVWHEELIAVHQEWARERGAARGDVPGGGPGEELGAVRGA